MKSLFLQFIVEYSLIPRPFLPPVFDCLQYIKNWPGNKTRHNLTTPQNSAVIINGQQKLTTFSNVVMWTTTGRSYKLNKFSVYKCNTRSGSHTSTLKIVMFADTRSC